MIHDLMKLPTKHLWLGTKGKSCVVEYLPESHSLLVIYLSFRYIVLQNTDPKGLVTEFSTSSMLELAIYSFIEFALVLFYADPFGYYCFHLQNEK
jgi:hypothetical protein